MDVRKQIEMGRLVCPQTKQRFLLDDGGQSLVTVDGRKKYPLLNGQVPILLADPAEANEYVSSSPRMMEAYQPAALAKKASLLAKIKAKMVQDYRAESSVIAFRRVFDVQPADALCLSVGGGPKRPHPTLTNLNIGPFPNVDVVADAHLLPYADASVHAIYCEAVLEHLREPARAVTEMYRVLVPGGKIFAVTPFLQAYHGYPHHYRNYTLTGHRYVFESHGFAVLEAGTCVGPMYTIVSLTSTLFYEYVPSYVGWPLRKIWGLIGAFLRPLDRLINLKENAHVLASTTYLVAKKNSPERKAPVTE